jgi:hypothetical protein
MQKPSENGRSIPIFDGEARNTAYALGSEACGDHILQRHAGSSKSHVRTYRIRKNVLLSEYQKASAHVKPSHYDFCRNVGHILWVVFRPAGAKNDPQDEKFCIGQQRSITCDHPSITPHIRASSLLGTGWRLAGWRLAGWHRLSPVYPSPRQPPPRQLCFTMVR